MKRKTKKKTKHSGWHSWEFERDMGSLGERGHFERVEIEIGNPPYKETALVWVET